jgi:hypothetical protein
MARFRLGARETDEGNDRSVASRSFGQLRKLELWI